MTDSKSRLCGEKFPCASLDEALPHLRRPPAAQAVRFKIQNTAGRVRAGRCLRRRPARVRPARPGLRQGVDGALRGAAEGAPAASLRPRRPAARSSSHLRPPPPHRLRRDPRGRGGGGGPEGRLLGRDQAGRRPLRCGTRALRDAGAVAAGGRRRRRAASQPQGPPRSTARGSPTGARPAATRRRRSPRSRALPAARRCSSGPAASRCGRSPGCSSWRWRKHC
jgi:hypothetical protein